MRITKLTAAGQEQKVILNYLEENASDSLVERINAGTKTLAQCWNFIVEEVRKAAHGSKTAVCEDKEVFGMAVHFFEEDEISGKGAKVITFSSYEPKKKEAPVKEAPKPVKEFIKPEPKEKKQKAPEIDKNQMTFDDFFKGGGLWS